MGFHRASPVKRRIDPSCASQPARQPPALRQPPGGPAVVRRVIPDSCQQVLPRSRPATPAPARVGQGAPPVQPARPAGTFPGRPVVRCVPERPRVDGVRGGVVALCPHASAAVPHVGGRGGGASCSHASAPPCFSSVSACPGGGFLPPRRRVDGVRGGVLALCPHGSAAVPHVGGRGGGVSCSHASAPPCFSSVSACPAGGFVPPRRRVDGVRGGVVALCPHASAAVPHVGGRGGGASCSHASAPPCFSYSVSACPAGGFVPPVEASVDDARGGVLAFRPHASAVVQGLGGRGGGACRSHASAPPLSPAALEHGLSPRRLRCSGAARTGEQVGRGESADGDCLSYYHTPSLSFSF